MLMGEGKTAVITPLLALLLADGQQLPLVCLPPALLDAGVEILRSSFAYLIHKEVFRMHCVRASPADARKVKMLDDARRARGVIVTSPATIKTSILKFIESLITLIDEATGANNPVMGHAVGEGGIVMGLSIPTVTRSASSSSNLGPPLLKRSASSSSDRRAGPPAVMRSWSSQRRLCNLPVFEESTRQWARLLNRFGKCVLIMDELDFVCHPVCCR